MVHKYIILLVLILVITVIGVFGSIKSSESQGYSAIVKAYIYDSAGSIISLTNGLYVRLATTIAGEDVTNDVLKVEQRFVYTNIVLAAPTTTIVKSGPGFLHMITFNRPVSTGTVTCYDNTAASGTLIGTITSPAGGVPVSLVYDVTFSIGLTCVTATAAQDITISSR
jgi:hypothetical protein